MRTEKVDGGPVVRELTKLINSKLNEYQNRLIYTGKLRKSLDSSTKKPVLDIASEGHLDTIGAHVMDSINESLDSPNLSGMFRGVKVSSDINLLRSKTSGAGG